MPARCFGRSPTRGGQSWTAGCSRCNSNRSQRNETALRWFLLPLLPADQRRTALERELADIVDSTAFLQEFATGSGDAGDDHPFRATAQLSVRINDVMLTWLREQLASI